MVAIDVNGTIKTYYSIPKSWGNQIGVNYMSEADQNSLGFYEVVEPTIQASQELGDIYFDEENNQFTYQVNSRTISETLAELKTSKIEEIKTYYRNKLVETDWIIVRDQELGNTTDQSILDKRAQLRTDCETHETAINAKTTKASLIDYDYNS